MTTRTDLAREEVRSALYEGLCWFGTLPEPEGDVPELYHRWDDLGELADRILSALTAPTNDEVRASVAFLQEAANYFSRRPTDGEDRAYWANVTNADNCRKAAALLERLSPEAVRDDGWQPIETAPRDGTVISLTSTSPLWKYPFPARWSEKLMWWEFADYPLNDIWAVSELVSHWRPLPPPPAMPEPREIAEKEDEARKHLSPLERQKAAYRPLQSIDEILGLERERLAVRAVLEGNSK